MDHKRDAGQKAAEHNQWCCKVEVQVNQINMMSLKKAPKSEDSEKPLDEGARTQAMMQSENVIGVVCRAECFHESSRARDHKSRQP
jgi:hypothetical protein